MYHGNAGMGMRKHRESGHATRSPRYKFLQTLERNREDARKPRRRALSAATVAEAVKQNECIIR